MSQIEYQVPVRVPLSQRFNWRIIIFAAVVLMLIGYPVYVLLEAQITGGVKNVAGGYKEVDLKAMSTFSFDQTTGTIDDIPQKWRELDGQKVILYGEIWAPTAATSEITNFQLCYSIAKCCGSGDPLVQHFVNSKTKPGKPVNFYNGLVCAKGVLHVKVFRDGGKVSSIYQMDIESVEQM